MKTYTLFKKILLFLALTFCFIIPVSMEVQAKPVIQILQYPKYGEQSLVSGKVVQEDGSSCTSLSGYRIIFYIQITDGTTCYVKPGTSTNGVYDTIKLQSDGTFYGNPYSYGEKNDLNARYIHVLLVPSTFVPKVSNYSEALSVSKDHVTITRETNGSTSLSPFRTFRSGTTKTVKANLSVSKKSIALNVDFYTTGKQGRTLSESDIKKHLKAIQPYTDTVRFYSSSDTTISRAYKIAHEMGFKIIGTAWISGNSTKDKKEMDALIRYAKKGWISLACVGSETQYAKIVSVSQLIKDITYVKERVPQNMPVTTADTLGIILGEAKIRNACDVLFVNSYPIYEKISIENAASHLASQVSTLQSVSNGKQVIISETGYATKGSSTATEKNAARYFEDVRKWSVSKGIVVVYFMSADAQWKESEDAYGAHWGLMTRDLKLKSGYANTEFFKQFEEKETKKTTIKKKSTNTIKNVTSSKKIKYSAVKKNTVTFKITAKVKGNAKLTYKMLGTVKNISISETGKVTLKKGMKKGTYKIRVQIMAAETSAYYKANVIKSVKIIVK